MDERKLSPKELDKLYGNNNDTLMFEHAPAYQRPQHSAPKQQKDKKDESNKKDS